MFAWFLLCAILRGCVVHAYSNWDYDQTDKNLNHWPVLYPQCSYRRQSPIDLPSDNVECEEPLLLQWASTLEHYAIRNNGHSLQAIPFEIDAEGDGDLSNLEVLHHTNDTKIRLQNSFYNTYRSPVNKEYCFNSLHFHWGPENDVGSEHTVNGESYPLEVHLVHYSCDWQLASHALQDFTTGTVAKYDDHNVLAVVGVLFEIGEPNPVITQMLDDVIVSGVAVYHDPDEKYGDHLLELYYSEFDIMGLLPYNKEIIAYQGSLTTPPCFETVRWHVMKETMTVSQAQMDKFRSLLESTNLNDSMAPNFRPPQALNNRTIYRCQEHVDAEYVEKDAIAETQEVATSFEADGVTEDTTWFVIGLVFICLFAVSLGLNVYLGHFWYTVNGKAVGDGYEKTGSGDALHEEDVQDTHAYR